MCCCCLKCLDSYYMTYMWKYIRDENAPIKCHRFYYQGYLFRTALSFWNKHLFFNPGNHLNNYLLILKEICGEARKTSGLRCHSPLPRRLEHLVFSKLVRGLSFRTFIVTMEIMWLTWNFTFLFFFPSESKTYACLIQIILGSFRKCLLKEEVNNLKRCVLYF